MPSPSETLEGPKRIHDGQTSSDKTDDEKSGRINFLENTTAEQPEVGVERCEEYLAKVV